jgi:hypothetical protein
MLQKWHVLPASAAVVTVYAVLSRAVSAPPDLHQVPEEGCVGPAGHCGLWWHAVVTLSTLRGEWHESVHDWCTPATCDGRE